MGVSHYDGSKYTRKVMNNQLYMAVQTIKSVDEAQECNYSNESYSWTGAISCDGIYGALPGSYQVYCDMWWF